MSQIVELAVSNNDVVIFAKSYCPYCKATKALFAEQFSGVQTKIFDLDLMDDGAAIQAHLLTKTGQRTVPNVFVRGKHLGGNDDTQGAYKSGKLREMLIA